MNTRRVQNLARTIEILKSAKFNLSNWCNVNFYTKHRFWTGYTINTGCYDTVSECQRLANDIVKDLNKAIEPVLDKYIKRLEKELMGEMGLEG